MNQPAPSVNGTAHSNGKSKGGKRANAGRLSDSERALIQSIRAYGVSGFPAAETYQPGRTYIYYPLVDPRRELTSQSRVELLKKARFLYNAIGLARRAIEGPSRGAVGTGMCPKWLSKNRKWAEQAAALFEEGPGRNPQAFDAAGRVNFYNSQSLILNQAALDGDIFAQILRASDGSIRARFIEGTFVGNSGKVAKGFDEDRWFDGVQTDPFGRALKYRVLKEPLSSDQFTDVPADEMLHISRPQRMGYVRGPSALATAANHLHDLMDIGAFLKQSYKIAAQFPFTITSERKLGFGDGITSTTDATTAQTTMTDRMRSESGIPTLKPGESLTSNNITIPGETFDPFSAYLIRDIAWGRGTSPEVLWNLTLAGGANSRGVLVDAEIFYDAERDIYIYPFGIPFVRAWTFAEIEAGRLPFDAEWAKIDFKRPAKQTVDIGREGKLLMEQMATGFLNPDHVHAIFGRDGVEMDREAIEIAIRRKQMVEEAAKSAGVEITLAEVFGSGAGQAEGSAPPTPEDDDDKSKQGKKAGTE